VPPVQFEIDVYSEDICRCKWILGEDGEAHEFTPHDQEAMVRTVIEPMASDGLRTICLAYKDYVKGKLRQHTCSRKNTICQSQLG